MFHLFFNNSTQLRENRKKWIHIKVNRNIILQNACCMSISLEGQMQNLRTMDINLFVFRTMIYKYVFAFI